MLVLAGIAIVVVVKEERTTKEVGVRAVRVVRVRRVHVKAGAVEVIAGAEAGNAVAGHVGVAKAAAGNTVVDDVVKIANSGNFAVDIAVDMPNAGNVCC